MAKNYFNNRQIRFDYEHIRNFMQILRNNNGPSFRELVVYVAVVLLIGLEFTIIHGFDKSRRAS